ncbi:MAG: hypothetical protein HY646_16870 [Acidobacteria bacterium]|nr:hypothetical protein [Acidobacteriota bacterium]
MRRKWIFIVPAALLGMALFAFIGGEVVRLLWNWLLPPVFGWPQITFWQALGLLALCRILFGGFALGGGRQRHHRGRIADRIADRMADRVAERWEHMTPEERERFRQRVRERCGFDPAASESKGQ